MGLDRVLLALEGEGQQLPLPRVPRCFVVAIGEGARELGAGLVEELRAAGVASTQAFEERPLKAQLKMADRSGAAFTAIIGEREIADDRVTLRRLADGVQKSVPRADVARWLLRLEDWADAMP